MRDGSGTGAPEPRALTAADTPQTAPTTPSAPRQTDAEGAAPPAAGPWCPRPNAPPKAGEASPYIPLLGCYPGWRQAGSLRRRRRAPPKAAQTAVSPERKPAPIHEASLPTPKASLSSPRMQPTACLDPRSARRRAKRGARRGAITAHRLGGGPAHTSEPEESWARRARLDHYQDGPLRARGPCGDGHGRREGRGRRGDHRQTGRRRARSTMHSEGGRSWSLATEVPCWVCVVCHGLGRLGLLLLERARSRLPHRAGATAF